MWSDLIGSALSDGSRSRIDSLCRDDGLNDRAQDAGPGLQHRVRPALIRGRYNGWQRSGRSATARVANRSKIIKPGGQANIAHLGHPPLVSVRWGVEPPHARRLGFPKRDPLIALPRWQTGSNGYRFPSLCGLSPLRAISDINLVTIKIGSFDRFEKAHFFISSKRHWLVLIQIWNIRQIPTK